MGIVLMNDELRKLQLTQLEILNVVDRFCRERNIPYFLCGGTLLGAVRHQGFIPWDDDLDICMPRQDYDRFISAWHESSPDGFMLQNKDSAPAFQQSFTKIRKLHTTFLEDIDDVNRFYTGIFIDVFPVDRAPSGWIEMQVFYARCMLYQLFTREFIPPKAGKAMQVGAATILKIVRGKQREKARAKLLYRLTRYDGDRSRQTVLFDTVLRMKQLYPADFFDGCVMLKFETGFYPGMVRWDEYLTMLYGDYMSLPPESERTWKHHPIILDFEHDYEELQQINPDRLP